MLGRFFLPPIVKEKSGAHQLANMRRPSSTAYLRTFVSSISLISDTAFWIPDKRSFSGLKGIGGLVKPSKENGCETQVVLSRGFGLGSRPSVDKETIEKMDEN